MAGSHRTDLISIDDALRVNHRDMVEMHKKYGNAGLANLMGLLSFDRQYVRASGTRVWDDKGNEYLDFLGGYGALNLGHNPEVVLQAVQKVSELPNLIQAGLPTMAGVLARNLAQVAPGDLNRSFFCNSGAEAVEGALKLARIATGKKKIIYCDGSFHGKTMGALSVTGRVKYQTPFAPLVPECYSVPYGDADALETGLKAGDVAAFIVEPIQGEGGIIVAPPGYLQEARNLCDKYDALMIIDEIQTGLGRTGKLFACEHDNVAPDIMCLAKSLGGGVAPIGAFMTTDDIWQKGYGSADTCRLHTSTFGGNTRAAAAGIAALQTIVEMNLADQAAEKGEYFLSQLAGFKEYNLVAEARGRGLMIGIEFRQPEKGLLNKLSGGAVARLSHEYLGSIVAGELLDKHHIITAYTLNNPNVIRLEPPLTVTREEMDKVILALKTVFSQHKSIFQVTLSSGKSLLTGLTRR